MNKTTHPLPQLFRQSFAWGVLVGLVSPLWFAVVATAGLPGMAAPPAVAEKAEVTVKSIAAARVALQGEITATRVELAKLGDGVPTDAARWLTQETALLDELYTERDFLTQAEESLKRDLANTETMVQEAGNILQEKKRDRRAVRESPGKATNSARSGPGCRRKSERG